jgi:hypothetical protein
MLPAENELSLLSRKVRNRVERVAALPRLERLAPRVALGERADPAARAAVEVEVVRRGVHELVSRLGDGLHVRGRDPDENNGRVGEGDVVVEYHLLPHHRRLADLGQRLVVRDGELGQGLLEGLPSRVEGRLRGRILSIAVRVDLVAARAEERAREELRGGGEEAGRELGRFLGCEAELAGRRLCVPVMTSVAALIPFRNSNKTDHLRNSPTARHRGMRYAPGGPEQ